MKVQYTPVPSIEPYFMSDKLQSFCVGPLGSSKTTASILKVAVEARRVAKSRDGKRRSRYAIVRNTRQQLLDATIPDFLKWFPDGLAGTYAKTEGKFLLRFNDVESEIMFRGLDDLNDVRRLLSLQLTGAFMDECREINPTIFDALTGRIGRYPDGMLVPHRKEWGLNHKGQPIQGCVDDNGKSMKRIWGSTNPPDMDTFWHTHLTLKALENPKDISVTIQPGGLSQEADWTHLLATDYYEDLAVGKSEDWINVYIHGKWGESLAGKPVFKSFNQDIHVSKTPLRPLRVEGRSIVIGMDFGLNPSAVIGQVDMSGRLLIFGSLSASGMGLTRFIHTLLRPYLTTRFMNMPTIIVGDPAGVARSDTDERSCFDILKREGFRAIPAKTNSIVARIAAVDSYLNRQIDGKPGVIIDPEAASLILALRSGYKYKLKKSGELNDMPDKGDHSHVADAAQYLALHADGGLRGEMVSTRREITRVSSGGWT